MRIPGLYFGGIAIMTALFLVILLYSNEAAINGGEILVILLVNIIIWFISAEITDKYKNKFSLLNYRYDIAPYWKSMLVHIVIFYLFFLFYKISQHIYTDTFISIVLFYLIETILVSTIIMIRKRNSILYTKPVYDLLPVNDEESLLPEEKGPDSVLLGAMLEDNTDIDGQTVRKYFGDTPISCSGIPDKINNGEIRTNDGALHLKLNKTPVNKVNDINRYLTGIHSELKPYGYLILKYNSNRVARAEIWGRIYYYGFEVIKEAENGGVTYLLSQKKRYVSKRKPSSKSFLIRLRRVGFEGKMFYAYKLRSMYPYSEFIQKKVFEMNELDKTGKINEDFRITPTGKILRKYWIDELPQIINWLKSDIKLVGIRGMSLQYFNLYPGYYKEKYIKVKPGLVPPIFDNSNGGFESIVKTELTYLNNYLSAPMKTDFNLFITTFKNIILKGYRGK